MVLRASVHELYLKTRKIIYMYCFIFDCRVGVKSKDSKPDMRAIGEARVLRDSGRPFYRKAPLQLKEHLK